MPAEKMFLGNIRQRFFLGPRDNLRFASNLPSLGQGVKVRLQLGLAPTQAGFTPAQEIRLEIGSIYEIEQSFAAEMIANLGLTLDQEGLSNVAVEGA